MNVLCQPSLSLPKSVLSSIRFFDHSRTRLALSSFFLALAAVICLAGNVGEAQESLQVLHSHVRSEVATGKAARVRSFSTTQQLNLSIVLELRNQEQLTSLLGRLYDPSSPDFHHFLTVEQFTEQFSPTAEDYQKVVAFAKGNGLTVTDTPANRLVVPVTGSIAQINKAFNVTIGLYQHPTENRSFYSPDREPSFNLSVPVRHIAGMDNFSIPHPMLAKAQEAQPMANVTGSGPGGSYLGSDMRAAYYGGTTLTGTGQAVGLLEFGGYSQSNVDLTFTNAGQTYSVPVNNVLLDGATGGPETSDAEQVLDIVQAIGMAPGLSQVRVYIGEGLDDANIFNKMATENICKQLGVSWGWRPADPSTDDVFFQEFAAQGQTVFVASGDNGAFDADISPFFYPSEDDYVTSVGGTHLTTSGAAGAWASETVWNSQWYGSGGGISPDSIPIPSWQAGVATTANGGSTTLRNEPDVAMEGDFDNFYCENSGACWNYGAGTSFAAPRWAGFMALVNQQAVEAGNAPVGGIGFINSAIYTIGAGSSYDSDFHDVTSGNNDTDGQPVWFSATTGYDLTTGWGSANGQNLIDALAGKQVPGFWIASSTGSLGIIQGDSGTSTITVTDAGGFTGKVTLAVTSTLPSGVTASWGTNPTTGTSLLTFTVSSSATPGTTPVTITGTSGTLTQTTSFNLVIHGPSFSLSAAPPSLSIGLGASATSTITVNPLYGFTGNVTLDVSGLPSGVTASWGANPTSGSSVLTLTASSTALGGTANVTITGKSGTLTATTTLSVSVTAPSFTLYTQSAVSIGQGSTSTVYVFVNPVNGFTGSVNLSLSNLPSGVTGTWGTNPTTGTSLLTLTATGSAPTGQQQVTITGTSGALTAHASFTLGVYPPSFTLSSPGNLDIGRGSSGNSYVYVTPQYGFKGNVVLAVSGLPAGVTALWNPNPTSGTSTLTLAASSSTAVGQYTLTITGTSGSLSATTTLTLGVFVPTFTLSGGGDLDIGQGSSGSTYVAVYPQYGFTGNVTLSASKLPAGVTASFSPNPTTGSSSITLTVSSTATIGTYPITITGTSGSQTATTTVTLGIFAPTFTLSGPVSVTIGQGTTATSYVYLNAQYGFTGSVTLAASGLPAGVTASFSPNPTTGGSTLMLTASGSATVGQSTVTVTGTSGSQTKTTTFTLGVSVPTFTLWNPGSLSIGQGGSGTAYISINQEYGFTGSVNFVASGLPSGVTAFFSPNPTTQNTTLTLTSSSSASLGQYNVTITGTSGTQTATTTLSLGIYTPTFSLSGPGGLSIGQGTTTTSYVWVNPQYGFTGSVNFSVSGLPSGVTASFSPNPATGSSTMTLTASSSAILGQYNVVITGTSGTQSATAALGLGVYAQGFTLYNTQSSVNINEGSTSTSYIYIYSQYGFSGGVTLAASGLPSGVTASFSPNPVSSGSSQLTLTASGSAAPGTSTVTITGTSGSLTASTTMSLTVNSPGFTLSGAPGQMSIAQGGTENSTISIVPGNGFAGSVTLAATGLPSGVTASWSANPTNGASVLTLTASDSAAATTTTATITGTSGALTATLPLPVTVRAAPVATATTLTVASAGAPVTSVASGAAVTLTASVSAGSTPLKAGQVKFCDAAATTCEDAHLLGKAQLTSAGTAALKFIPGIGTHSYKAVFVGTYSNAASASGTSDLTVTSSSATTTTIAQSGAAGNYTLSATVSGNGPLAPTGTISFLDKTNGDATLGKADLQPGKTTTTWTNSQSPSTGATPVSIAGGDFNEDGIADLAVVNQDGNSLTILLGKGDGTFAAAPSSPQVGNYPSVAVVGDFNGDGHADLAVADNYVNSLTILLGNGDGTFTPSTMSPPTGYSPVSMAVEDFNGDGVQDLAVSNESSNTLTILLGNGDGTFTPNALTPTTGSSPDGIATQDFNGDGIPDLAVMNLWDDTVTILLGNGDGTFTAAPVIPTGMYPGSIAVGDFNGDGKPDMAVSGRYSDTLAILLGNGDGTFKTAASPTVGSSITSIAIGDLNGDGKADLAVAYQYSNTVTILLGNGDGTFVSAGSSPTGNTPIFVVPGDFNEDGVQDLAVANLGSNTLTVLTTQISQTATATASGISPVGQGQHSAVASYPGDGSYKASVSAATSITAEAITPAIAITPSASGITTTQPLTVSITVSGGGSNPAPTGSIALTGGTFSATQTLAAGSTTFSLAAGTLPAGSNTLTAIYTPDTAASGTYLTATQSSTVTVTAVGLAVPTITATPSAATVTDLQDVVVTISATGGSGAVTGAVLLSSGTYTAQQTLSSGAASFTIAAGTLAAGSNTLTATYFGDTTYATGSGTAAVTVSPVVADAPVPAPISPGASATGTVTFTAGSTYAGTLNLTCALTGSPTGAESLPACSLNPKTLTLAAGAHGSITLTAKTTAASSASLLHPGRLNMWGIGGGSVALAISLMFGLPSRRRRWISMLVVLCAVIAASATGCGGGQGSTSPTSPSTPATTAGAYTFTVTGTDTADAKSTFSVNVKITVQ